MQYKSLDYLYMSRVSYTLKGRNSNRIAKRTNVIAASVPPLQGEIPVEGSDCPIPGVETQGLDINPFRVLCLPVLLYSYFNTDKDITLLQSAAEM